MQDKKQQLELNNGLVPTGKGVRQGCILSPSYSTYMQCCCFCLVAQSCLFAAPWTAACQASLSLTISQSLPKFMFIASVMPSSHLILWCPLLLLPSIFLSIRTFPMSRLFASNNQNPGASASALPVNIQGWSPLRLTSLISLLSKGLSRVFSNTTVQKHQFFGILPSLQSSSHNHMWPLGRS